MVCKINILEIRPLQYSSWWKFLLGVDALQFLNNNKIFAQQNNKIKKGREGRVRTYSERGAPLSLPWITTFPPIELASVSKMILNVKYTITQYYHFPKKQVSSHYKASSHFLSFPKKTSIMRPLLGIKEVWLFWALNNTKTVFSSMVWCSRHPWIWEGEGGAISFQFL